MSLQSKKVLNDLIRCQRFEGNEIFVDYDSQTIGGFHENEESDLSVNFRYPESEMISIFNHLASEDYIIDTSGGYWNCLSVTHKGNHHIQTAVSKIFRFLSESVVVPIMVAFLTSVVYNLLARWFPWLR